MSYCDLLERMMQKDTDAFLEMTDRYGWALYSDIRKKYPNKADADRIYDETMQYFYRCMQNPNCEDPVEALLCAFADKIAEKQGFSADYLNVQKPPEGLNPPVVQLKQNETAVPVIKRKRKGNIWLRLCLTLVCIGFAAVVWIGIGLMMEAGILPYYDLGYSWFFMLVSRWI